MQNFAVCQSVFSSLTWSFDIAVIQEVFPSSVSESKQMWLWICRPRWEKIHCLQSGTNCGWLPLDKALRTSWMVCNVRFNRGKTAFCPVSFISNTKCSSHSKDGNQVWKVRLAFFFNLYEQNLDLYTCDAWCSAGVFFLCGKNFQIRPFSFFFFFLFFLSFLCKH